MGIFATQRFFLLICASYFFLQLTAGANILLMSGDMWSHVIQAMNIGENLRLKYNHTVKFLLSPSMINKVKNSGSCLNDFIVREPDQISTVANENFRTMCESTPSQFYIVNGMKFLSPVFEESKRNCELLISNVKLMKEIEKQKFDLVILDGSPPFFECYISIAAKAGISSVIVFSRSSNLVQLKVPFFPGVYPVNHLIPTSKMSLVNRLENIFFSLFSMVREKRVLDEDFFSKYCQGKCQLDNMKSKIMLYLIDQEPIMDYPKPSLPNIQYVGGLGVSSHTSPIPLDLKQFMDNSKHGVLIVSFGSYAKTLPANRIKMLISTLLHVPNLDIVFNYHKPEDINSPKIFVVSWLPQKELLGHKNTKIFVTHCGNGGRSEALYHGVPMLGIPLNLDQPGNCQQIKQRGFGLCLDFCTFNKHDFLGSVQTILNGTYKEKIKHASRAFRNFPEPPSERAAFWVDHFYKHNNSYYYLNIASQKSWIFLLIGIETPALIVILTLIFSLIWIVYRRK